MKGNKEKNFKGRLFYAIVPNRDTKCITFYFTKANALEGRGVARGLPLFIRDYYKLDPAFFCSSEALTDAMEGSWTFSTRQFLTAQEKMEIDRLDEMEMEINAEPQGFISKDHQRAMAMDTDDVSIETRLTKGNAAPPPAINDADNDEMSALSNSTRESKAQRYADSAVKDVVREYSGTILNMTSDLGAKDDEIAKLQAMLHNLRNETDKDNETPKDATLSISSSINKVGMVIELENDDDDNLSYEPEELSKLDPTAFSPVFEKDVTSLSGTSESPSKKRGGGELDNGEPNLKRPRTASITKPSSSEEAMVL